MSGIQGSKSRLLLFFVLLIAFVVVLMFGSTAVLMARGSHYSHTLEKQHAADTRAHELMQQIQQDLAVVKQKLHHGGLQDLHPKVQSASVPQNDVGSPATDDRTRQELQKMQQLLQQQLSSLGMQSNKTMHGMQQLLDKYEKDKAASGPTFVTEMDLNLVTSAAESCSAAKGVGLHLPRSAIAPVVILAHDRVKYLAKTLISVLHVWSSDPANAAKFPIVVSVDGGHQPTLLFVTTLKFAYPKLQIIQNIQDPGVCHYSGFCNLSWHYKMLLQRFFKCENLPRIIFLEDDMEVSPDFFSFFEAAAKVLASDKSLWCVSAWNDHGQEGRALNNTALYRTDIMPGLGWMLERSVGLELLGPWPKGGWDEWMRRDFIRKNRQCIFPEVSRTHTFGNYGTSGGEFYKEHLAPMLLNQEAVDWATLDLSYLHHSSYSSLMTSWISHAEHIHNKAGLAEQCSVKHQHLQQQQQHQQQQQQQQQQQLLPKQGDPPADAGQPIGDLVVGYADENEYQIIARSLHPMLPDLQAENLPRASSNGTVVVRCQGRRLFIVPSKELKPKLV